MSIAVLLLVGLAAAYWTAYRPLPQTTGQISAPISAAATVARDSLGVPHIKAATWEDAIFLQGYVTAQDRLWQMDALRRLAAGELSEIVGPSALETDRDARRLRMRRMAEEHYRTLPAADRAVLAAYARGVNYFIETHRDRLPLEFTILRYDPRPWRVTDSILCALHMYRTLTTTWKEELQKLTMLENGDQTKVNLLFPSRIGTEVQPGSNAWAISGKHTSSGKPILASDPHLEFSIPSTWHQVHLQAPGLDVIGVSIPGLPGVIVGHNRRIAWGVTNLGFDVQDLYMEKIDPRSGRYVFRGRLEQARAETEWIAVQGRRPVEFRQWVTRHGPVSISEGNRLMALRWSAAEPGSFQFPFLDLDRAGNWEEFTRAIARFSGPAQNFVYADVDGNIGYHATGQLPIRKNYDGDVPVDGSSGDYEWDGFIPFEQLPSFYNPPQGWVITANQNPFPENYPYRVHGAFVAPYRSQEIRSALTAREHWKPAEMLAVEKDVYSAASQYLARQVVAAYDRTKPANSNLQDAIAVLRSWNGQMEKQTPAPMLISMVYQELKKRIAESAAPGKSDFYAPLIAPAVVEKILRQNGQGWFQDRDALLIRSLTQAIQEGRNSQGSNVKRWDYGKFNELTIKHPVGDRLPLVGGYFNIGPVEMSGSSTSIKQTTQLLGPSMRFVADLSDWDHSLNNLTIGESGQILSSHYKDQWGAYYVGRSFPMQFDHVAAAGTLTVQVK
ncbi:MAG: penicillin acylase family protein [Acidobacteriia bacterium]|nr:penicillin acylase family protein [Terriglobia bacterium]